MEKIRIAIAEDHTLLRQTLVRMLSSEENIDVVLEAENGKQLVDAVEKTRPQVVILDIEMPVMDGFAALDHLQFHYPDAHVIMMSMYLDGVTIKELVKRGARGFIPKNADFDSLRNSIFEVLNAGYYFSDKINPAILNELLENKEISPTYTPATLTQTELRLLHLICKDKTRKEIARIMDVSLRTLERYKTQLYKKTRVKSSAGLVLYAIQHSLYSPLRQAGEN